MSSDGQQPPLAPEMPPAPAGADNLPPWRKPAPEPADRHDDDWWDRLYADGTDTGPAADWWTRPPEPPEAELPVPRPQTSAQPQPVEELTADPDTPEPAPEPRRRLPTIKTGAVDQRAEQVRQHLHVEHRTWVLLYNGSAATLGWSFGLVDLFGGWITDCGRDYSVTTALLLGSGIVVLLGQVLDRRTRGWWGPLPWICRAPLASAVLALGLYAPASL
ncbi:hypothetical protein [Streptomyces qinglanensis]|uniref:Uncharacterized protein n=1 Tax=Streptomyces qinglanensis TaxID=943816 RepID=A0A1H9U2Y9_9ACTN|nr:hypothetical protein [Streptomyces qinglanensis]SES03786.1 hypothetical protein SAMN05421870_107272 [Streptomyces qinglanensis]